MADPTPIPLTVLGGWLGAGKTTLLNRVLASTGEHIAVIVNDVGEINVDAALIASSTDDVVELTNGCVCCSIGEDFELTLIELTLRDPAPDRIVVEASGVADPTQIAAFATHRRVVLDAVITLAEAAGFTERSSRPPYGTLQRAQVAGADLVIATKLDLVDPADHAAALDELHAVTSAPVVAASADPAWIQQVVLGRHDATDRDGYAPTGTAHVVTRTWRPTGPVDIDALTDRLRASGLLRAKGGVSTPDGPKTVHLAGGRVTVVDGDDGVLDALVLIGGDLDQVAAVLADLDAAIA